MSDLQIYSAERCDRLDLRGGNMTEKFIRGPVLWRKNLKRLTRLMCCILGVWLNVLLSAGTCFAADATAAGVESPSRSGSSACVPATDAEVRQLDAGTMLERELGGGQNHSYRINVSPGQFLRVIVDQRGIDIVATICAPDGKQIAKVDRPNGAHGPEAISILSDQEGLFILQVRSLEKATPVARYQVRIAEQRNHMPGDDIRIEAEKSMSEGEVLRSRGKLETLRAAVEKFELARTLWHSLNEPYEVALSLYGLGWSHSEIGSHGMVKFPIPVHRLRWSYESRSEHERAIDCFNLSLALMRQLGDGHGQALAQAGLAWPQLYLDLNKEALESFESAYQLFRTAGNIRGEAIALYGLGWINAVHGEDLKALDNFLKSLPLRQASKDRKGEAITLAGISRVQNRLGRNQEAADSADRALAIFSELRDAHGQASTYYTLGWINYSSGRPQPALEFFEKALGMRREAKDSTGEANSLYGIARVHNRQGNLAEALKRMEEVLGIIEPLRAKGESGDLRTYYFAYVQEYYEFYIDLLMRLNRINRNGSYAESALAAHERARARELLAILAEAGDISPSTGEAFSRPLEAAEIKGLLDDDNTLLLEYALGEEMSYVWLVSQTAVRGYEITKRAEIEARARKLYHLFTARNQRSPGEKETQRRDRIEQADRQYAEEAAALSRLLLGPIAAELGVKRLVIIAEGALQIIPFGALPSPSTKSGGRPLILDHEIVSLPSASVLSALRHEVAGRAPAPLTLAMLADPVFTADDPRVRRVADSQTKSAPPQIKDFAKPGSRLASWNPRNETTEIATSLGLRRLLGTRWEGQQIASLIPDGERLLALDFGASRARALSAELRQYRIIHFATHALINDADPAASTVVLSQVDEQGRPQDGALSLHDIYQLKLRADLVVLSACRTGLGQDVKGEGMRGLTGGFMHAGVPRIVVSLWPVNDQVTAEFMVRFYRLMLSGRRMSPAAALREVQTQMLKDERWQSPYFWAPFIVQGEWR
jgi:CHAT domain-containing protein